MRFHVIDKTTGKEADTYNIALKEKWAMGLMYCDMEGFFVGEEGDLILTDECGNFEYCDMDRFEVQFDDIMEMPEEGIGEMSDGYHTFNQLYHQRAILFATIVNLNKSISWKSWKHEDGKYCFDSNGEWFIVGIDTPEGSYTYHYEKKYWDYFKCQELECGKHWDGHTEKDVTRLLSIESKIDETKQKMCDIYCKLPELAKDQEELDKMCAKCPLDLSGGEIC